MLMLGIENEYQILTLKRINNFIDKNFSILDVRAVCEQKRRGEGVEGKYETKNTHTDSLKLN